LLLDREPGLHAFARPTAVNPRRGLPGGTGRGGDLLWDTCRPADGKADSHRTVFLSDYHHHQRQAAAFNATEERQALLAGRWKVEPVISWLVNYQGCRRARRVGQAAAQFQLFQACAVRNLLMWINRRKRM
jgi:hypothetical protein